MTPAETLEAAALARDEDAVRALLADLPEAERAELVPVGRQIVAAVKRMGLEGIRDLGPTLLMAYGLLPVSEIRTLGWRSNHIRSHLEDVLRRRSPERLIPIVEHLLDDVGGRGAWRTVRPLIREGIVPRPDRPSYTLALLSGTRYTSAAELLADDPSLLEVEVWRLFEVEGGGHTSLANDEKFAGDPWGGIFRELASSDPAMRERLLDASLVALARDFGTWRAGWFSRFHESLGPTDDERAQRTDAYLGLLRSRSGPTVSFAVAALVRIDRAGRLPPDALLDRIAPVLGEASGGTAKAGVGLVGAAGAGSPERGQRAAIVATNALAHPSPDVQRAAIALIGVLVVEPDDAVARAVAARLPEIAASQRSAAADLVARLGGSATRATQPQATADAGPAAAGRPSPIDPDRAIEPLSSLEALVDVAVSVLESGEPADDVERVLDGVGRLAAERPEGFARLTAPLAKRARTILARRESRAFSGFDPKSDIAAVLLAWATGETVGPDQVDSSVGSGSGAGAGAFLSARSREVAGAVAAGRSFVSVAAPTHIGGWIDPVVLVGRVAVHLPASTIDLVAAILRLAPTGRDEALSLATGLVGEVGAVLRYALGGDVAIGATAPWWVAAARVRAPGQDDRSVEERHPRLGPDAGLAGRVRLITGAHDLSFFSAGIGMEVEPPLHGATSVDLPTVLMLHDPSSFFWMEHSDPVIFRWMATIQPGYREAWAATGGLLIARNVDWWSARWGTRAFLEPFIDPVTAIGPHARALLGFGLGQKEAGERGLATDVVRLALADGRLTAPELAEGLAATAAVACDRPNRWALSLTDVAAQSDAHARAVAEAIARTLPALAERPPAKLVPLLRLLDELTAGTGVPPAGEARPSLERLAGAGGQTGRLSRSILSRG